jgi:hypothetical protein
MLSIYGRSDVIQRSICECRQESSTRDPYPAELIAKEAAEVPVPLHSRPFAYQIMLEDLWSGHLSRAAASLMHRPWPWRDVAHVRDADERLCVVRTADLEGQLQTLPTGAAGVAEIPALLPVQVHDCRRSGGSVPAFIESCTCAVMICLERETVV